MKSTDIKNHKTSISQTHNLEVPGSSPGWSTLKTKQLSFLLICLIIKVDQIGLEPMTSRL